MNTKISTLINAGAHFGHKKRFSNSKMMPYIHGIHQGVHIIDLVQTKLQLDAACKQLNHLCSKGGKVLFVGTKPAAAQLLDELADITGMPAVTTRWLGGTLTNYKTIRNSVKQLDDLDAQIEAGQLERLSKKEQLMQIRRRDKLLFKVGGIRHMKGLPDVLFVIDAHVEKIAITEANKLGIPVIAIVDTNTSPEDISHVIPGNDDSQQAIQVYVEAILDAVMAGKAKMQAEAPKKAKETVVKSSAKPVTKKAAVKSKVTTAEVKSDTEKEKKTVAKPVKQTAGADSQKDKKADEKPATKKKVAAKTVKKADSVVAETKPAKKATAKKPATKKDDSIEAEAKPAKKVTAKKPAAKKTSTSKAKADKAAKTDDA